MRGKMIPETFRENLWQDNGKNSPRTLISPGAGDMRHQVYLLMTAVLKTEGVRDQ